MNILSHKRFLAVMRHEKSIAAVYGFVSGLGAAPKDFHAFVLERDKDGMEDFNAKMAALRDVISTASFDCLILATKVNDAGKESQFVSFLQDLGKAGLKDKPVILTHLGDMEPSLKEALNTIGLNLHIVENDNLGFPKPGDPADAIRTGMSQLGPKILEALQ